ncbi:hypothetical protein DV515_00011851 [Chloebia gouldiae]|uniref:Uncharacterized protein n=1 Tax=Chloebia gouldiae TaxID=44316 RepID=A0A3L8S5T6_CHLGU|nr:hypothetical protein DV515_00011851 [Chloebia gouldiae]
MVGRRMSASLGREGHSPTRHSLENALNRGSRTCLRSQQRGNPVSFKLSNKQLFSEHIFVTILFISEKVRAKEITT